MSSFPSNPTRPSALGSIPSGYLPDPESVRQAKQAATDALVARTRASTPPGVADQRRVPRQSIAEINNSDWDTIRERFLATRRDDRPAWVRVLDAIDAPRNQILSHLAPSLERKARESGETAAFGTGRVNFSDVLGELGMKPGVVRAVVGLVGDLAFDPLTYVGAPGVGLKVANKAGQTASIGLRGSRELVGGLFHEGAIKAVKRGGLAAVKPGATRDLLEAAAKTAQPGLDNAALASHLSERVLGRVTSGKVGRAFSRIGGALEHEGGSLANYGEFGLAGQLDDEARAARAFIAQYGAGAGPGLRIGKGATRAVAHIPFTDVSIYVPAFTGKGKYAADTLRVARDTGPVDPLAARGPGVAAADQTVQKIRNIEEAIRTGNYPVKGWEEQVVAAPMSAAPEADAASVPFMVTNKMRADLYGMGYTEKAVDAMTPAQAHEALRSAQAPMGPPEPMVVKVPIHATADDLLAEADDHLRELNRIINGGPNASQSTTVPIAPATPRGVGELLSLKRLVEQAEAARDAAAARVAAFENPGSPGALAADAVKNAEDRLARATEGAARNWAINDPEKMRIVQRLTGTDDDITGSSLLGTVAAAATRFNDQGIAAELLHRADQGMKATFGQPGGMVRSMWRYLQNTLTTGGREAYTSLERELRGHIVNAMETAGIDPTLTNYEKAANLTTAYMAVARNEQAAEAARAAASLAGSDLSPATDMRFFLTDYRTGELLPWVENLRKAERDGFLSAEHGAGLSDALKKIAAENNHMLDTLGSQEYTDGLIRKRLEGYLPNEALTGAKRRMAAQKKYAIKRNPKGEGKAYGMATESFQKERSSDQYRFIDGEGKPQRFFEFDRWVQDFKDNDLAELAKDNPERAAEVSELKRVIDEWDARAADPEWRAQNAPRNTHPAEMNDLARSGRFKFLLGGDKIPGGDFMDTNAATMMAARAMAHETAVANRDWLDFASTQGISVPADLQGHAIGKDIVLTDGTLAKTFRDPKSQMLGIEVAGKRYRPLAADFAAKDNPILMGIGETTARLYHEDIARLLEESAKVYEQQGPEVLKFLDAATAVWKTQSLMHPSWTVANLVGDTMNYLTGGVRIADLTKNAGPMAQVFRHIDNPEELRKITLNIRGAPVDGEKFVNDLRANRLMGINQGAETALQLNTRGLFYLPSQIKKGKTGVAGATQALNPRSIGTDVSALKGEFLQDLEHTTAAQRLAAGAKASGFVMRDRLARGVIGPWFRANEVMQDYMRAMAYASFLEQGHDIPMAVRKTINAGFDYADLTRVERNVFRRIFPFYCVPDHSEILTRNGWKHRADLVVGEDVMTYSIEKDCLEWQPCLDVAAFDHDQDLTVIENKRGLRLECTDEHRWVVRTSKTTVKGKKYGGHRKIVRACDFQTNHSILMTAEYHGTDSLLTPEQARLYGWLLTDGYWRFRRDERSNGNRGGSGLEAVIYQSPKKFLKEVTRIAGGKPRNPHPDTGVVCVPVLRERLEPLMGLLRLGKDGCGHVPAMLSRDAAAAMYEAMYQADGTTSKHSAKAGQHMAAMNPAIRECFKLLAFMLGKRTTPNSKNGCYVSNRRVLQLNQMTIKKEHFFGKVWCPNTANDTWVMRQNGTITISGNTWMKNNGAYQLKLLLDRPIYTGMYPLLLNAAEEAINGDQQIPLHARPNWMRNQLALMVGKDNNRQALMLGSGLPVEQAIVALEPLLGGQDGVQDFLKYFTTGTNTLLRTPAEIGTGREWFTDRTIGRGGDIGSLEYVANQFRPYRETGKVAETYRKQGPAQAATRLLLGGRVQSADDERLRITRLREFKAEEEKIRRAIATAGYKSGYQPGSPEFNAASVKPRAMQLRLYEAMAQSGFEDEVPKWALAQLGQITTAS